LRQADCRSSSGERQGGAQAPHPQGPVRGQEEQANADLQGWGDERLVGWGCGCSGGLTTRENATKGVGGVVAPARPRLMERENRFEPSEMRQESRCPSKMEAVGANSVFAANTGTGQKLSKGKVPVVRRPSCIHFPYHAEGRRCSCSLVAFSAHPLYFRIEKSDFIAIKYTAGKRG